MKIKVFTKHDIFPEINSSHVSFEKWDEQKISDEILKSDIVIGNGSVAQETIGVCKPCIIVGERGFGGTVLPENLGSRYENDFLGRLGGELNEYIPERVLWDSVLDIVEWDAQKYEEIVKGNKSLLQSLIENERTLFNEEIHSIIAKHKKLEHNIENSSLKISNVFALFPVSDENSLLVNRATRQIHANLEKEELEIIQLFEKPTKLNNAIQQSEYANEPEEFTEFVKELLDEKILELNEKE